MDITNNLLIFAANYNSYIYLNMKNKVIKAFGIFTIVFFTLANLCLKVFYEGRHSKGVVISFIVFSSLSGIFLFLFLILLASKLGND